MGRLTASILLLSLAAAPAHAALLQATSVPARAQASVSQDALITVSWRLTTDITHIDGAQSAGGEFLDAVTGARLAVQATAIGALSGGGTLQYLETLAIPAAQLAQWRAQGVRLLGYRRTFTSRVPPPQTAQLLISLRGGGLQGAREPASGELRIQRMELEFTSGRRIEIVEHGVRLTARVALSYAGSGMLRARWEIADPAGAGAPFFRTLAQVREPLNGSQIQTLVSPPLPTDISGRYVLRFCLDAGASPPIVCEASDTAVQTLYQVTPGDAVAMLRGIQPDNLLADAATVFRWPASSGVTNYQLQIFRPADPEPTFVAGMLLDATVTHTALSESTRARLSPGERYLWRITAHDGNGELLAHSETASFIYQPAPAQADGS